jgi:hypothetical protein
VIATAVRLLNGAIAPPKPTESEGEDRREGYAILSIRRSGWQPGKGHHGM